VIYLWDVVIFPKKNGAPQVGRLSIIMVKIRLSILFGKNI
jgi:hypothetical protein